MCLIFFIEKFPDTFKPVQKESTHVQSMHMSMHVSVEKLHNFPNGLTRDRVGLGGQKDGQIR